MEGLLRRLIGEDVSLEMRVEQDLCPVLMDPGQLEQILANLAANARDAMPQGGRLEVEAFQGSKLGRVAGSTGGSRAPSVCLRVSDSGTGMPTDVIDHIFEPFFTTKVPGKGTVRALVERQISQLGYTVVSCPSAVETMRAMERHTGSVDLLVTDVVMPSMNGRLLAERVRSLRPQTRILYMSGYGDLSLGDGKQEPSFIAKPFSQRDLALAIRMVLDRARRA